MDKHLNSVTKAFWYKNTQSPIIFMVDDLANIYFHSGGKYNKGDWGGLLNSSNSLYSYLKANFIENFPDLKFTFFLVAGEREVQSTGKYDFVSDSAASKFGKFLDELVDDGHEIAYHGNKHGVLDSAGRFIQEWSSFSSVEDACSSIKHGLSLISVSSKAKISGGKYCGYEAGKFGHQSIVDSNFSWWFDEWDSDIDRRPYGELKDNVFYIPSNIDCSVYPIGLIQYLGRKKFYRSIIRQIKDGFIENKIKSLLKNKGIISLQEHSSPLRTDGKTQYPNVFDDFYSIKYLLSLLSKHDVWWATANQVAEYSRNREYTKIEMQSEESFSFTNTGDGSCSEGSSLSLIFSKNIKSVKVNNQHYGCYIKNDICMVDVIVSLTDIYYIIT